MHHVVVGIKNSDTMGAPASMVLQASSIKHRQSLQRCKEPSSIVSNMLLLGPIRVGGTVTRTATEAVYTAVIFTTVTPGFSMKLYGTMVTGA